MLLGQLQPAIQTGNTFAEQDLRDEQNAMGAYGRLGRKYQENPNDEIINRFIDVLGKLGVGDMLPSTPGAPVNTPTPGLPAPSVPALPALTGIPGVGSNTSTGRRRSNFGNQFKVPGIPALGG
jgi:hypothetical protein